jgi:hypothetical protein
MCTVNITDFNNNPAKYIKKAQTEQIMIQDEGRVYQLMMAIDESEYISGEELIKRVHKRIDKRFPDKV